MPYEVRITIEETNEHGDCVNVCLDNHLIDGFDTFEEAEIFVAKVDALPR